MPPTITLIRDGTLVGLDPTTPEILALLAPHLTYTLKTFLRGRDKFLAQREHRPTIRFEDMACYNEDYKGRLVTQYGFADKLVGLLEAAGYRVKHRNLTVPPRPEAYLPRWERILDDPKIRLRYKQKALLRLLVDHENGRIDCPTGFGKSFCMALAAILLPKARIDVLTRRVPVLCDRIYPELCAMLPAVGIVGGGKKIIGQRVMCYTFGSMHHAEGDADYVLVDEAHEAAADDVATKWGRYDHARFFGFSASHDLRLDGKDLRCEGLFGPVRLRVSYQKAVEKQMVVPIEVHWTDVIMDLDPCGDAEDVAKKRLGIWSNAYRNKLIRRDARSYGDDQVLITVATFEHALYLKRVLPEFKLMYNGASIPLADWKYYQKHDLLPPGFELLTDGRRQTITRRFEQGKIRRVIATPVWNVGVDMRYLQVIIRADGGGSPINDVQVPGRTSRRNDVGKQVGIVRDYRDLFNSGFARNTAGREASYTRMGWPQHYPDKANRSALRRLMNWGDDAT